MNETNPVTVTLLHSNDLHSDLEAAARIAAYVKDVRRFVSGERLLLVDCGDHMDRARLETEGTKGGVNRAILEATGYEAMAVGNNEGLTFTRPDLDTLFGDVPFPVLCANLAARPEGNSPEWLRPYAVVRKSGVRFGLIGLTAPFRLFYEPLGWRVEDPFAAAREAVERLRPQCDVIVVLSHLGLSSDERLAREIPGIDLILGSHTHHLLERPVRVGNTFICAAGKSGRYIGHLEIDCQPGGGLSEVRGGCVLLDGRPQDPEIVRITAEAREQARLAMGRPVARLEVPMETRLHRESPLSVLLAIALRQATGAQIGLTNNGQLLAGLPAGTVTWETLHAICPSPINPALITICGKQLRQALEESLLPEFYDMKFQGFGFRGVALGGLSFDGMEAVADLRQPPRCQLVDVRIGGEPLDDGREYTVGTLDMFTFGVGYKALKEGRVIRYLLPEFIRDLLAKALGDPLAVRSSLRPRWRLVDDHG
jgi:2',3'-cyclic-nucleotide 2'-phosphodiesterase (5'-nucleotidase family)